MKWPYVAGLGSHHGDDQAGWLVLEQLRERHYPIDHLLRLRHPAELLNAIDVGQNLIVCDACMGNAHSGIVRCFDWPDDKLDYQRCSGSHDLALLEVLELGRRLKCVPGSAKIWVIEGALWAAGMEPTNEVMTAAGYVADLIKGSYCDA